MDKEIEDLVSEAVEEITGEASFDEFLDAVLDKGMNTGQITDSIVRLYESIRPVDPEEDEVYDAYLYKRLYEGIDLCVKKKI